MLDLSVLKNRTEKNATKRPVNDFQGATQGNIPTDNKNAVAGRIDPLKGETVKSIEELDPRADDFLLQVGIITQNNIKKGNLITWAINKAVKMDAPPEHIALLSVKEISLLTNDDIIFKKLAERYREKYGIEVTEKYPYEVRTCKTP